jgi:hypothetical protein
MKRNEKGTVTIVGLWLGCEVLYRGLGSGEDWLSVKAKVCMVTKKEIRERKEGPKE